MLRLQCAVQHYDWGRIGAGSEVGQLHALASGDPVDDVPYAELWMGTHTSGPTRVVTEIDENSELLLKDWLAAHSEALGPIVLRRWEGELPFLFKVDSQYFLALKKYYNIWDPNQLRVVEAYCNFGEVEIGFAKLQSVSLRFLNNF